MCKLNNSACISSDTCLTVRKIICGTCRHSVDSTAFSVSQAERLKYTLCTEFHDTPLCQTENGDAPFCQMSVDKLIDELVSSVKGLNITRTTENLRRFKQFIDSLFRQFDEDLAYEEAIG